MGSTLFAIEVSLTFQQVRKADDFCFVAIGAFRVNFAEMNQKAQIINLTFIRHFMLLFVV